MHLATGSPLLIHARQLWVGRLLQKLLQKPQAGVLADVTSNLEWQINAS
ncbi:hypothetical protein FAIPA1_10288 [Frankia sp. AiPs1]